MLNSFREHKLGLAEQGYENVDARHNEQFASWFRKRVRSSFEVML